MRGDKTKWANDKAQAGWLCRVASNRCVDELRKKTGTVISLDDELSDVGQANLRDGSASVQDIVVKKETLKEIQTAINRLSPMNKQALVLRDCMEMSYEEVSRIMNMPMGTVKSRINRAREALKKLLIQSEQTNAAAR
jgi:RNA polymerase sigma-70 factor (ECF subfamily)